MKITPWNHTSLLTRVYLIGSLALLSLLGHGQTPSTVTMNDKNSLTIKTATNQTYFLWQSQNLTDWLPVNTYVIGDGTQKTVSPAPPPQPRMFYRFGIAPTNALNPDDTDGDGILNTYEMNFRLYPNWINSVTDLAVEEVDSRISSTTALSSLRIYNNYTLNGAGLIFESNPDCWMNSIQNKSCISPWNSYESNRRAGTLITPRHVIFCAHFDFFVPTNYKIYFVTDAGEIIERTVLRTKRHPSYGLPFAHDNDIVIWVLDQDLPSTIKCVKFFPNNWNEYMMSNVRTPSLRLNQDEEALVGDLNPATLAQARAYHVKPTEPDRLNFYYSLANPAQSQIYNGLFGGDSGNGGFAVINSQLILTNVWTYGGPGSGTSVTNQKSTINSIIAALDTEVGVITGHSIQEFDFSQFMKLADIPPEFIPIGSPPPIVIQESDYPLLEE